MILSVCLITKNEEANINRAINSVKFIADEIIVTDTGSTDNTIEIASSLGARIFNFEWRDDFSAARNFSIEQARGDWILWLDADEELLTFPKKELTKMLGMNNALAYNLLRQDLQSTDDLNAYTEMWQLRLFRNRKDMRFIGRCHPDFRDTIRQICIKERKQVYNTALTLRHYGYVEKLRAEKLQRAAKLLRLELQDRPGQLYYLIELGRTLLMLGDEAGHDILGSAIDILLLSRGNSEPPSPITPLLFEYLLNSPSKVNSEKINREEIRSLQKRWFPYSAPLIWLQAQNAFNAEQYPQACELLEELTQMGRLRNYDRTVSFDPRILGDDAVLNLGVCYVRLAELSKAEACFQKLLTSQTRHTEARQNLDVIRELRKNI